MNLWKLADWSAWLVEERFPSWELKRWCGRQGDTEGTAMMDKLCAVGQGDKKRTRVLAIGRNDSSGLVSAFRSIIIKTF